MHNGAEGRDVDFICKDKYDPRSENIPEYVVVKFHELYDDIEPFINKYPKPLQYQL